MSISTTYVYPICVPYREFSDADATEDLFNELYSDVWSYMDGDFSIARDKKQYSVPTLSAAVDTFMAQLSGSINEVEF